MAFCSQCGATLNNGEHFCPSCGAKISEDGYASARQDDPYAGSAATDSSRTYAILAVVFPFLFFLPLVTQPRTQFGVFWANQSLLMLLGYILSGALTLAFIGFVAGVIIFIFWIMSIVAVCHDEMKPIPWVGSIEIIKY